MSNTREDVAAAEPQAPVPFAAERRSGHGSAEAIAGLAKALAHPARIHIIRLLLAKQSCIGCDIVDQVGLAQSTVSEHLRILKAAGVIVGEIERPRICYSLNPASLAPLAALLAAILAADSASSEVRNKLERK